MNFVLTRLNEGVSVGGIDNGYEANSGTKTPFSFIGLYLLDLGSAFILILI